ncbi:hypothetical protein EVAR_55327_1 [Eumeta japonica]|uniref:Uncharacterized protein n=1 Tax=Eumeta variegata TaxID=151549 RepID=A0A4C1ZBT6_EUMVA|nr:hypothetical protein EVAR_55327_1 [Eumeta japonica]
MAAQTRPAGRAAAAGRRRADGPDTGQVLCAVFVYAKNAYKLRNVNALRIMNRSRLDYQVHSGVFPAEMSSCENAYTKYRAHVPPSTKRSYERDVLECSTLARTYLPHLRGLGSEKVSLAEIR